MIAWALGWQELLVILFTCVIPVTFIPGLVMLIVGLTQKKRGLWVPGLILMVAPLALVLLGAAVMLVLAACFA